MDGNNTIQRSFRREAKLLNRQYEQLAADRDRLKAALCSVGQRAAAIGETLQRVKDGLPHGSFGQWISQSLTFDVRQAQKYIAFYRRVQDLPSPALELLSEEWRDFSHPAESPNAHHEVNSGALLPATERAELMRTEGGVEPEERDQGAMPWIPASGKVNVGGGTRNGRIVMIYLVHDPSCEGVVRICLHDDATGNVEGWKRGVFASRVVDGIRIGLEMDPDTIQWDDPLPIDSATGRRAVLLLDLLTTEDEPRPLAERTAA